MPLWTAAILAAWRSDTVRILSARACSFFARALRCSADVKDTHKGPCDRMVGNLRSDFLPVLFSSLEFRLMFLLCFSGCRPTVAIRGGETLRSQVQCIRKDWGSDTWLHLYLLHEAKLCEIFLGSKTARGVTRPTAWPSAAIHSTLSGSTREKIAYLCHKQVFFLRNIIHPLAGKVGLKKEVVVPSRAARRSSRVRLQSFTGHSRSHPSQRRSGNGIFLAHR